MIYYYYINLDERGEFDADIRNDKDETVFEITLEDAVDWNELGLVDDVRDPQEILEYLVEVGIFNSDDEIEWGQ